MTTPQRPAEAGQTRMAVTDRDALSRVALEAARASYFRQFGRNFPVPRWDDLPEMAKEGYRDVTDAILAADPLRAAVAAFLPMFDEPAKFTVVERLEAVEAMRAALDGGGTSKEEGGDGVPS